MITSEHEREASGISESREVRTERAEEIQAIKQELEPILARIAQLTRLIEAAKKAALTDRESRAVQEKAERIAQNEVDRGTDQEFAARIGKIAAQQLIDELHTRHIGDSPQGRELERLQNRRYDLEARLEQLESEERR